MPPLLKATLSNCLQRSWCIFLFDIIWNNSINEGILWKDVKFPSYYFRNRFGYHQAKSKRELILTFRSRSYPCGIPARLGMEFQAMGENASVFGKWDHDFMDIWKRNRLNSRRSSGLDIKYHERKPCGWCRQNGKIKYWFFAGIGTFYLGMFRKEAHQAHRVQTVF